MAKFAIISSKQLAETNRWDAPFNIEFFHNKAALRQLQANMTRGQMLAAAKSIPINPQAARIFHGNRFVTHSMLDKCDDDELGLYLLQIKGDIDAHIASATAALESKVAALGAVHAALGAIPQK